MREIPFRRKTKEGLEIFSFLLAVREEGDKKLEFKKDKAFMASFEKWWAEEIEGVKNNERNTI